MKLAPRPSTLVLAALALGMAAFPAFAAADPPPAVKPAPPADTKSTPIRFTLQLLRVDDETSRPATGGANSAVTTTAPIQKTIASPTMTTLDGSTATISVVGDDLSYTLSLSPAIAANGKILTLWNLRLSGKSLPGATAVTATGATKIDGGKPSVIAEVSLTDPANGHRATFILQGTTLTGDAATDNPPPALPTVVPATPPTVTPAAP